MKKVIAVLLIFCFVVALLPATLLSVSAETVAFSTDFKDYKITGAFKFPYDINGNHLTDSSPFSVTERGLRYKRSSTEKFYNPSGDDKTTLGSYKLFPVNADGSTSPYLLEENRLYKVTFSYVIDTLSSGASVSFRGCSSYNTASADGAYATGKYLPFYSNIELNKSILLKETGSGTVTGYFNSGTFSGSGKTLCDRLFFQLDSSNGCDIDMTLTSFSIAPLTKVTVTDVNTGNTEYYYGQSGEELSLSGTSVENYLVNGKGTYSVAGMLFTDSELTQGFDGITPAEDTVLYTAVKNASAENQVAFCGFDTYRTRAALDGFGFTDKSEAVPTGSTITDEAAFSGKKSLKVTADSTVYIGNGKELEKGTTYRLSLFYRSLNTENADGISIAFGSGNSADETVFLNDGTVTVEKDKLNKDTAWREAVIYYTAKDYSAPVLRVSALNGNSFGVYIDSCVITSAVSVVGTSVLNDQAANTAGSQAMRFVFSYDLNGTELSLGTKNTTVVRRGMLVASAKNLNSQDELCLDTYKSNSKIMLVEPSDLNECWNYDSETQTVSFSTYVNGINASWYDKQLVARAFVVTNDGEIYYSSPITESVNTVKSSLEKKDMFYKVNAPKKGLNFCDFDIYTQTSDVSGNYYIVYHFAYENEAAKPELNFNEGTNDGANCEMWRIKGADIVEKTGEDTFRTVNGILQAGEIELAISENGAGDFIGGFHGDEHYKNMQLVIDGKEIDLKKETSLTACKNVSITQDTVMYRCNSSSAAADKGQAVMEHSMYYTITARDGFEIRQTVKYLVDDFRIARACIGMFTINRENGGRILTDVVEYYKWDGSYVDSILTTDPALYEKTIDSAYGGPGYAKVYGLESGVNATCGYKENIEIGGDYRNFCWIRPYKDNKCYFSAGGNQKPATGTVWDWTAYYSIDYNTAIAEIAE